tara:strand:+ start:1448 stop:1693 length:246 start_codon:yes stop_codon:yes gene_type:complete
MDMTKVELRKFIKENEEQIKRFAANLNAGRLTRNEQKRYTEAFQYIVPKVNLCFTCGRSAQIMGVALLRWQEDNKPKKRKK